MEQIVFDSSYLLRPATFLEDLSCAFDFLRAVYLFNHSNCSHPSLEVVHLFLCFMAAIHSLKCTVSFSFVVPPAVIFCHSLSFVVTRRHFFSLVAISCHSLPFVVTRCTTRCNSLYHSLSLVVPLVVTCCTTRYHSLYHSLSLVVTRCTTPLSLKNLYPKKQSAALWEELR